MPKPAWTRDWTVGVRIWMDRRGEAVLGEGRAELLSAIGRTHSITAAAKVVGMSYRKAWNVVREVNEAAGEPLVTAAVGGVAGGGAQLTPKGRFAVELFEQLHAAVRSAAVGMLHRIVAPEPDSECIHLSAAISLQDAIGQILIDFALRQPAIKVRTIFGASNELADHLLGGAPGDLFITGDASHLQRLHSAGMIEPGSRTKLAINGLAAISAAKKRPPVRRPRDLADKSVEHLALAEPASPLGSMSREFLTESGLYETLRPKIVQVDNARAVVTAVESGAVEVGLAYSSDATQSSRCQTLFHVPATRAGLEYEAAVIHGGRQTGSAKELLKFLNSSQAARRFRCCGLLPVRKPKKRIE